MSKGLRIMTKKIFFFCTLLIAAVLVEANAFELVAPAVNCSLNDGSVMVIGIGAKGSEGVAEWDGGKAEFKISNSRFNTTIKLAPGKHKVKFTVGGETVDAEWNIGGKENLFTYHEEVASNSCTSCHDPKNPPSEMEDVSSICYECHDSFLSREHVHGPVRMGMCAAGHSPHGSVNEKFLRVPPLQLCTFCHEGPVKSDHPKSSDPCISCHNPHGSAKKFHIK